MDKPQSRATGGAGAISGLLFVVVVVSVLVYYGVDQAFCQIFDWCS